MREQNPAFSPFSNTFLLSQRNTPTYSVLFHSWSEDAFKSNKSKIWIFCAGLSDNFPASTLTFKQKTQKSALSV